MAVVVAVLARAVWARVGVFWATAGVFWATAGVDPGIDEPQPAAAVARPIATIGAPSLARLAEVDRSGLMNTWDATTLRFLPVAGHRAGSPFRPRLGKGWLLRPPRWSASRRKNYARGGGWLEGVLLAGSRRPHLPQVAVAAFDREDRVNVGGRVVIPKHDRRSVLLCQAPHPFHLRS